MKKLARIKSAFRWPGGKYYQARATVEIMPPHKSFMDTHCGAMNVLLTKPMIGCIERASDINRDLTNFWQTIRDPKLFDEFMRYVAMTPLSEIAFEEAIKYGNWDGQASTRVAAAANFFVRIRQSRGGQGKDYVTPTVRLRRGINEQVSAWLGAVDGLPIVHDRLSAVEVLTGDAVKYIMQFDAKDSLYYSDSPYMHSTRVTKNEYGAYEMSDRAHAILLATYRSDDKVWLSKKDWAELSGSENFDKFERSCAHKFQGLMMLCGYQSDMYDKVAKAMKWQRLDRVISNSASSKANKPMRTESIWVNYDVDIRKWNALVCGD